MSAATLPPVTRPGRTPYRPRKVVAHWVDGNDGRPSVLVLGTHDLSRAQALADTAARHFEDSTAVALNPVTGWWRDGMQGGDRAWVPDDVHGRAGIWFTRISDRPAEILREWMTGHRMDVETLGRRAGAGESDVKAVLCIRDVLGGAPLLPGHAEVLAAGTGISAAFWLGAEARYREDLAAGRTDPDASLGSHAKENR